MGAHLIETFQFSEQAAVYWFGLFYAVAFLFNMLVLKDVELYVKGRYATTLFWFNVLLIVAMLVSLGSDSFGWPCCCIGRLRHCVTCTTRS